jgi:prepilin-type N-terminal cleavage/methylation domain-containing protein/prepilin-type processing-associated H-X9-DG protein
VTRLGRIQSGFTLVELLVTMGLIGVLLSILLPTVSGTRRQANALICMSNLRQWGLAMQMYANQNNGYLARRGQGVGPTFNIVRPTDWFNALPPLIGSKSFQDLAAAGQIARPGDKSVWLCPEATDMGGPYYWSYGMNMGLCVWEMNVNNGNPDKITGVGNESIMVLFADAPGNYDAVFPSVTSGGYNPVARHPNTSVNICFLDGHVEPIAGSYIGVGTGLIEHPDIRWHPPGSPWNSAR